MVQEVSLTFEQSNLNSFLTQGQVFLSQKSFYGSLLRFPMTPVE